MSVTTSTQPFPQGRSSAVEPDPYGRRTDTENLGGLLGPQTEPLHEEKGRPLAMGQRADRSGQILAPLNDRDGIHIDRRYWVDPATNHGPPPQAASEVQSRPEHIPLWRRHGPNPIPSLVGTGQGLLGQLLGLRTVSSQARSAPAKRA
jgi:hypothetical protein